MIRFGRQAQVCLYVASSPLDGNLRATCTMTAGHCIWKWSSHAVSQCFYCNCNSSELVACRPQLPPQQQKPGRSSSSNANKQAWLQASGWTCCKQTVLTQGFVEHLQSTCSYTCCMIMTHQLQQCIVHCIHKERGFASRCCHTGKPSSQLYALPPRPGWLLSTRGTLCRKQWA